MKFNAGIGSSKPPVDFAGLLIASPVPFRRFFSYLLYRGYPR
jgi:hypothetical protein